MCICMCIRVRYIEGQPLISSGSIMRNTVWLLLRRFGQLATMARECLDPRFVCRHVTLSESSLIQFCIPQLRYLTYPHDHIQTPGADNEIECPKAKRLHPATSPSMQGFVKRSEMCNATLYRYEITPKSNTIKTKASKSLRRS